LKILSTFSVERKKKSTNSRKVNEKDKKGKRKVEDEKNYHENGPASLKR
jgi:hypothetical protein